ncbi:MAG: hypothetical protein PHG48_00845 [Eubacteriales bacterium]|nr:hypothetical protein [Eubacteriales bacterium]
MKTGKSGRSILRAAALIIAATLSISVLGACEKDEDSPQTSPTVSKTVDTAAKTTAKAVSQTAAVSGKTEVDASQTVSAGTTVAAAPTEVIIVDDDEIKEEYKEIEVDLGSSFVVGDYDLGGKTIVMGAWGETSFPSDAEGASPDRVARYLRVKEAEKKYNFKMEYRLIPNFNQYRDAIISESLAGIKFADVLRTQSGLAFPTHVSNNMIVELDKYIDFDSKIIQQNQYMVQGGLWRGKHYGIYPTMEYCYPRVFYNKAILDREGLTDILDLVETDQWNWVTFLDTAVKTTKDFNGDGLTDQWGVSALTGYGSSIVTQIMYSNGVSFLTFDESGRAICNLDSPPARRALQFVSDLNNIHKVYTQDTGSIGAPQKYMNGFVTMYLNAPWYHRDSIKSGMQTFLAPLPKGPDTEIFSSSYSSNFESIMTLSENPEAVARIWMDVSLLWDEDGNKIKEYEELMAIFPYDWSWSPSNPNRTYTTEREHKLSWLALVPLWRTEYLNGYPSTLTNTTVYANIFAPVLNGTKSVGQAIEEQLSNIQGVLDQYN